MKIFILVIILSISSCSVGIIQKHRPFFKSTRVLSKSNQRVFVNQISEKNIPKKSIRLDGKDKVKGSILDKTQFQCRLTTIDLPKDMTVRDYLYHAITDELDAAMILDKKGQPLNLFIHQFSSNTASLSTGYWVLDFEYGLGGKKYRIKTKTDFESAFAADVACKSTADSLSNAVGENILEFFKEL